MKSTFIKSRKKKDIWVLLNINERTFKISVFHRRNCPPSFHCLMLLGFFTMKIFPKYISAFSFNVDNF